MRKWIRRNMVINWHSLFYSPSTDWSRVGVCQHFVAVLHSCNVSYKYNAYANSWSKHWY